MGTAPKPFDADHLIQLYAEGLSMPEACRKAGAGVHTGYRLLTERGLIRAAGLSQKGSGWAPANIEDFIADYRGGLSVNAMAGRHEVPRSCIVRVLRENSIGKRGRSEAERLKWSQMPQDLRKAQIEAAHIAARRPRTPVEMVSRARLKQQTLMKATKAEADIIAVLAGAGLSPVWQMAAGKYNIDIALHPLAVEPHHGCYFPQRATGPQRMFDLFDAGWSVLVIDLNDAIPFRDPGQVLAFLDELGRLPSPAGHYRVVGGDGHLKASGRADAHGITLEKTRRDGRHSIRRHARPG